MLHLNKGKLVQLEYLAKYWKQVDKLKRKALYYKCHCHKKVTELLVVQLDGSKGHNSIEMIVFPSWNTGQKAFMLQSLFLLKLLNLRNPHPHAFPPLLLAFQNGQQSPQRKETGSVPLELNRYS